MTTDILTELRKQTELLEKILQRLNELDIRFEGDIDTVYIYNTENHYHDGK